MPEKICPVCGDIFSTNRKHRIYCSRDCAVTGRTHIKDSKSEDRIEKFIEEFPEMEILDVLDGKLKQDAGTDNYLNVKGARTWQGKKFKIIVYE
jgi:hypothetical protein